MISSPLSGITRANIRPAIADAASLAESMIPAGVPARLCTAVSTMRLWAMRTMTARIVIPLAVRGMFTATAMAAYMLTSPPVMRTREASPGKRKKSMRG